MGTPKRLAGPAYLANSATNVYQGAGGTSGMYDEITKIHLVNESSSDVTVSLWLGASGGSTGGTTLLKTKTIKANDYLDVFGSLVLASTEYIVGLCSAATTVAITIEGKRHAS
jgi:hypothetical protein